MGGAYLRSRIKQAGKWDQETIVSFFLCQYCSGEYLPKNGRAHTVFISPQAKSVIEEQAQYANGDLVFESDRPRTGEIEPILVDSITRALRRLIARCLPDMDPFTVHDLRRSAATNWAERLDVEERVIELCLNHTPINKLVRTYHRSRHTEKTRLVWINWGRLVADEVMQDPVTEAAVNNVVKVSFNRK